MISFYVCFIEHATNNKCSCIFIMILVMTKAVGMIVGLSLTGEKERSINQVGKGFGGSVTLFAVGCFSESRCINTEGLNSKNDKHD